MFEFSNDSLIKSHFLFKDGKAIYLGAYGDGRKGLSSPLPVFKNERIRNDSTYEAEITFPFSFKGDMDILLLDTIEYEKEFVDKYNINLTITNFDKSWKVYELLLDYSPAEDDSLAATEQIYKHTINVE
ncbi:hypothetical protein GCM10028791_00850 [Echinicola sediminis]